MTECVTKSFHMFDPRTKSYKLVVYGQFGVHSLRDPMPEKNENHSIRTIVCEKKTFSLNDFISKPQRVICLLCHRGKLNL